MTNTKNEKSSFKNRKKYFIAIITIFIFLSILLPLCFSGCASTATPDTKITPHDFDLQDIKSANSEVDPEKMMSAIMAYYNGNIELSIKLFEDILKTAPGNRKALLSLVRLLKERGEYKRATAVLSRYDARCIGSPEINNISGTMWEEKSLPLFLAGNYEEFLNEINTFSKLFSNQTRSEIRAENHFFAGWAYKNLGMQDKAIEHFSAAIRANDFFPVAHLKLGQIHYRRGDFRAAERELTEALRQDFNLTQGRPYLARAILNQGRLEEGYAALKRALAIRPWDTETKKNILEFEEQHPAIVARRAEQAQERRRIAIAPVPRTFTANPDAMPQVRIGLGNGLQEFFLKTGYNFSITDDSNNIIFRGGRDYILKIKFNNGSIDIYDENEKLLLRVNTAFHLIPESSRTTTILFDVSHSVGHQTAGQEDRAYRGRFRFIPVQGQGITIVNTLALEEYLYSVVPSEMPPSWPPEALAAQAIAARSYTLANMGRFSHRGYDLSGSILSAFYRGYTGEDIRTTRAVEETRGIFLKHNGRYVNAFYSANTGGRTEYTRS
ncbi:MAG: SpoIID/LytB domain-containing protein, partial [Spirochaetes bacterium]|nr:SpoIID/LytB domain-containing protein [Spirochaetota bacterium]